MSLIIEQQKAYLDAELRGIRITSIQEQKWFRVNPKGGLYCCDKPVTIWEIICEYLSRLFSNPFPQLQNRVIDLTEKLNAYLKEETDQGKLQRFLKQHTVTLNALYHACFKLQARGRISGLMVDPDSRLSQFVLCPNQKNTIIVVMNNNWSKDLQVCFKNMIKEGVKYTKIIKDGQSVQVSLQGLLGSFWQYKVQDSPKTKSYQFVYAAGIYKFDRNSSDTPAFGRGI